MPHPSKPSEGLSIHLVGDALRAADLHPLVSEATQSLRAWCPCCAAHELVFRPLEVGVFGGLRVICRGTSHDVHDGAALRAVQAIVRSYRPTYRA